MLNHSCVQGLKHCRCMQMTTQGAPKLISVKLSYLKEPQYECTSTGSQDDISEKLGRVQSVGHTVLHCLWHPWQRCTSTGPRRLGERASLRVWSLSEITPFDWTVCALCCCRCCQLHQHPLHEKQVSHRCGHLCVSEIPVCQRDTCVPVRHLCVRETHVPVRHLCVRETPVSQWDICVSVRHLGLSETSVCQRDPCVPVRHLCVREMPVSQWDTCVSVRHLCPSETACVTEMPVS